MHPAPREGLYPYAVGCPSCGIEMGRDVIVTLNHEKRYLASKGYVLFTSMPCESTLEILLPIRSR